MFDLHLAYNHHAFHWWQLFSAHFIHYDAKHLTLNALALPLLIFLFPSKIKTVIYGCALAILFIDGYLLLSSVQVYAGFSGVLYAIPGIKAGQDTFKKNWMSLSLILIVLCAYVFIFSPEQHTNTSITWHALKQSHLLGFLGGILAGVFNFFSRHESVLQAETVTRRDAGVEPSGMILRRVSD